jgi:hypothetical protein
VSSKPRNGKRRWGREDFRVIIRVLRVIRVIRVIRVLIVHERRMEHIYTRDMVMYKYNDQVRVTQSELLGLRGFKSFRSFSPRVGQIRVTQSELLGLRGFKSFRSFSQEIRVIRVIRLLELLGF